jgi:hypothetical protein
MTTIKQKTYREKLAKQLVDLIEGHGGWVAEDLSIRREREITLYLCTPEGVAISICLEGACSQPETHCIAWCFWQHDSLLKFSEAFGITAGGSINTAHRHKCTAIQHGEVAMLNSIRNCLTMVKEGTAFLPLKADSTCTTK